MRLSWREESIAGDFRKCFDSVDLGMGWTTGFVALIPVFTLGTEYSILHEMSRLASGRHAILPRFPRHSLQLVFYSVIFGGYSVL